MKKIISIICCLLVLIPVLSISVSASEESETEIKPQYTGMELFSPTESGGGTVFTNLSDDSISSEWLTSSGTALLTKNLYYAQAVDSCSNDSDNYKDFENKYTYKESNSYPLYPYWLQYDYSSSYNKTYVLPITNDYVRFLGALSPINFNINDIPFYYFTLNCHHTLETNDEFQKDCYSTFVLFSRTPFSIVQKDDYYTFESLSIDGSISLYRLSFYECTTLNDSHDFEKYISNLTIQDRVTGSLYFKDDLSTFMGGAINVSNVGIGRYNEKDFSLDSVYSNFDPGIGIFKDGSMLKGSIGSAVPSDEILFSNFIDFKLTPEFTINMDRIYNKETGDDSYFKFEITNNSTKNLQWSLSIVTAKQYEIYTSDSSGLIYKPDTEPPWTYLLNETYYNETFKYNKKFLFNETYIFPELYTGLFQYHLLKSGDSYTDVVAWENVNIKANEEYVIILSGFSTDYDFVSDVFRGTNSDGVYELYPSETTTNKIDAFNSTTYDGKLSEYQLSYPDLTIIYSCNFSVLTIPDYNKNVSIGKGSSYEGSPNELYDKEKNWQFKTNITNNPNLQKTEYNDGYVDPGLINVSSVNVDFSNVTIDDVKGYVASCSSFFDVLSTAFYCFPSYIWLLICFGITALVVIGIVKALL